MKVNVRRVCRFRSLTLLSALVLAGGLMIAQNRNSGEIRGTVTDETGAVIPGADVLITNTLTGATAQYKSGGNGVYDAPSLEPGTYSVSVSNEGFKKYVRSGIDLHVEPITIDAVLSIGTPAQEVSVVANAPLVQTESSDKMTNLTSAFVRDLPIVGGSSGRQWYDVLGLLPGVNGGGWNQDASGAGVGVNGSGSYQSNFLIDGGVGTYPFSSNPGSLNVPVEAISELNLSTSNFSAEYGSGNAVFNVITKSGTNDFHGSAFEYVQNDAFNARNFFSPTVPITRWNSFGGTVGGRVIRDKLFFFFSYERNISRSYSSGFYTYPTAAMKSGDFSDPNLPIIYDPATFKQVNGQWVAQAFPGNKIPANRIDPAAAKIQSYFPNPTLPGLANNLYFSGAAPNTWTYYNYKVDYNISTGNRLTGSGMVVPANNSGIGPTCPAADCGAWGETEIQAQITDVWTLSPTMLNEFRISFERAAELWSAPNHGKNWSQILGLPNLAALSFPNVNIGGTVPVSIGGGVGGPLDYTTYFTSDTLTWTKGRHILKFGGEYDRWQNNQAWNNQVSGNFNFDGTFTRNPADPNSSGLGYADFLLGQVKEWDVNIPPVTGLRSGTAQAFVQDDFKLRPNLTINMGLRYQYQPGWSEVHNRISTFDPSLINPATGTPGAIWFAGQNGRRALTATIPAFFSPRVGFAWSPRQNWAVRGGYGIYPNIWNSDSYGRSAGGSWSTLGLAQSTDQIHPAFILSNGPPGLNYATTPANTPDSLNGQDVSYYPYHTPMSYSEQYMFDVQRQFGTLLIDGAYVGKHGVHQGFGTDINQVPPQLLGPGDAQSRRPYPQYGQITGFMFVGQSNYNSLQLQLRKRFSGGFNFTTSYTYSKALDSGTGSGWGGTYGIDQWQRALDWKANYGPALTDITHLWNGGFVYELPFGKGKRYLADNWAGAIIGGWEVSSTFQVHGGVPFTPLMGTANLSGALSGYWYPDRVGKGTLAHPTINQWFDTAAFVQPAQYTFGNTGRNVLRTPGFANMNSSLMRNFPLHFLHEDVRLQFRVDAYNVLNHPNFGFPNQYIGSAGAGTITYTANNARTLQLGAKLTF